MNFAAHRSINHSQWNQYRHLELIPESVPNPGHRRHFWASSLNVLWRPLLAVLIDELVEEQRVEYLDRCWSLNASGAREQSPVTSLHRFWVLIE